MLRQEEILKICNKAYPQAFQSIEFLRDGGSLSYAVYTQGGKYFVRMIRPELMGTALQALQIHE